MGYSRVDHIVLGYDGSAGADHACEWLAGFAAQSGAEVIVVQGYDPLSELGKAEPPLDLVALKHEAEARLADECGAALEAAGVKVHVRLVEDDGVRAVVEVAREEGAGLIVVGSHGRTGWRERIMGRVAMRLPQESPCPVVIVPQPEPA